MLIKNVLRGKNFRLLFGAALLGLLGLTGCIVAPGPGVAYVGPPAEVVVAPVPVVVGPEVVVPFFIGGGGRYRR
jgi:hypothetical protein